MNAIKNFFRRLFCKHDYKYVDQYKTDGGMRKRVIYQCNKCGKVKLETV